MAIWCSWCARRSEKAKDIVRFDGSPPNQRAHEREFCEFHRKTCGWKNIKYKKLKLMGRPLGRSLVLQTGRDEFDSHALHQQ